MKTTVAPYAESTDLALANPSNGMDLAGRSSAATAPSLLTMVLERWLTALLVSVVVGGAGVGGIWYLMKPKYEVAGLLHISPVARPILFSDATTDYSGNYRQYVGTQAVNIASAATIDATLATPEVRLLESLKDLEDPVSMIQTNLVVQPVQSSELLKVALVGRSPKDMEIIVNTLLTTYLKSLEEKQREWDRKVLSSLKKEQEELEAKLQVKNSQLRDVATEQGIGVSTESGMLVDRWLSDAHQMLTEALKNRAIAAAKLEALGDETQDAGTTDPASYEAFVGRDPELLGLKEQLRQIEASAMSDAGMGRGPSHPEVLSRPALIEDLRDRITKREQALVTAFSTTQRRELQAALRNAEITARVLGDEVNRLKGERAGMSGSQFVLDDLRRERTQLESSLSQVREKIWTVEVEQKRASQIQVDSWAKAPQAPNLDKRLKICAVVAMMGIACGVGAALVRGRMDRSMRRPEQVVQRLGVRVLGSVEHLPIDGAKPNGMDPRLIEPIRGISSALMAGSPSQTGHSRLITSPTAGSGKSSMALNLARSLVATGRKVLLIDGDNHGQGLTRRLNLLGAEGLCEFLEDLRPAATLVKTIEPDGLHVLPCGSRKESFGDLLRGKTTGARMADLYRGYDEVIVDSPPVLVKSDAVALAMMVDEVVLVLRARQTRDDEAQVARQYLESVRGNVVGVILNDVDPRSVRYGYNYSYSGDEA